MKIVILLASFWIQTLRGAPHCCNSKNVGGLEYILQRVEDTSPYHCLDNCVYTKIVDPGHSYCFAAGDEKVLCMDEDAAPQRCPGGWATVEHPEASFSNCYLLFEAKLTWFQANIACGKIGANLATIKDKKDNDLIVQLTKYVVDSHQLHIGGIEVKAGTWAWVDGTTAFDYQNWDGPSDRGGENCLSMAMKNDASNVKGRWNDVTCNTRTWSYVCSKRVDF